MPVHFLFRNYGQFEGHLIDAPILDSAGNRLFGTNYAVELYGGPTPDSLQPAQARWTTGPARGTVTDRYLGQAGYFSSDSFTDEAYVNLVPPRGVAWLQVRTWDTRLGATYEDAVSAGNGGYGASNLFQAQGGSDSIFGEPPVFPKPLVGLESFRILEVPEPSSRILMLLGLLCCSGVRRARNDQ